MLDFTTATATGATLSIRNLSKAYTPGKPVLQDISLDIGSEGLVAIIGPSGTGKSTLLRCINRLVTPTSGSILFEGADLARVSGKALRQSRRRIGMVFQEYNLVERLGVIENVLCGRLGFISPWRAFLRRYKDEDIQKAFELIEAVGLDASFATRRADQLSGGQRQRVGIARALMQDPGIVLADEPTSSLDPKTSVEIMELMKALNERTGIPILVNIHDVDLARKYATRVIGMSSGAIVYDGPPDAMQPAHLQEIYGGEGWM